MFVVSCPVSGIGGIQKGNSRMGRFDVGALVMCRTRNWVVLPSDRNDVMRLRPLGGSEAEACGIYLPIEGNDITPATFPPPIPELAGDFVSAQLLRDAARLSFRNGAGPFRSLGRMGVRPRPYQLVPLIMALRLPTVRLLIADDVGVGKTIEAGVIVRELLDRGEIRRLTVLCPPHLCDQWQRELREKFSIDAVIVRSNTIASLDRSLPRNDISIFDYYPFTVASIDYVKSDRHRDGFLHSCPACVIVDEAHTATRPHGRSGTQQQRYNLVQHIASDPQRHLLLLTATPHSGIEVSFQSLLGLLRPDFADLDFANLSEQERDTLAHHFIQRRRADVKDWLGEETPFPTRQSAEISYAMPSSSPYRALFDDVYSFARELITKHDTDTPAYRQRVRYWAALALLRCVMSSPAAAAKALRARASVSRLGREDADHASGWGEHDTSADEIDEMLSGYVYDTTDQEGTQDTEPSHVVDHGSSSSERAKLRRFADRAATLYGEHDPKLQATITLIKSLLKDGYNPIIYCRYIATANYLADQLHQRFAVNDLNMRVLSVTGERSEQERETLIAELLMSPRRILVATDCLSEGVNLQESFDAVVHYDLPWNPNRLEQREGRVDRYGQRRAIIRTALIMSHENPMDEAVMKVLLRKAMNIHSTLGISVPIPTSSKDVLDALIGNLFQATPEQLSFLEQAQQATLWSADEQLQAIDQQWEQAVKQEKASRTRFAQRRIKPQEVAQELEESDEVLGDVATVQRFVLNACERLGAPVQPEASHFCLPYNRLPEAISQRIAMAFAPRPTPTPPDDVLISFTSPAPQGIHAIGRNHALTTVLADYLLETALEVDDYGDGYRGRQQPPAARSSLIRSSCVKRRTTLLLLRVRMIIDPNRSKESGSSNDSSNSARVPMLAEELILAAYEGNPATTLTWLAEATALDLLANARPDANVRPDERSIGIQNALQQVMEMTEEINQLANQCAARLQDAHRRVRRATSGGKASSDTVRPHLPPDLLGIYVIMPMLSGQGPTTDAHR